MIEEVIKYRVIRDDQRIPVLISEDKVQHTPSRTGVYRQKEKGKKKKKERKKKEKRDVSRYIKWEKDQDLRDDVERERKGGIL